MLTDLFIITNLYKFVNTVQLKVSFMTLITIPYDTLPPVQFHSESGFTLSI